MRTKHDPKVIQNKGDWVGWGRENCLFRQSQKVGNPKKKYRRYNRIADIIIESQA